MKDRILIIEDDFSIANLQKDYLEINDMEAVIETDGRAGLEAALNLDFDMILVDVMLPGINGFDICKAIREEKQTPIMIVSAKKEDIDKIRGLGLGANDYMIKPFSPNELVARVKAHIHNYKLLKPEASQDTISHTNLSINKSSHKVYVFEKEIVMTKKEFQLLLFLMEHPNRVWSKESLFEQIWDMDIFDTDVATVVVHVKRIREKLKKAGLATIPIETVWGVGYRFNL
ncbi:response regulator transcription factor [Lactococcus garvieae]|jgi:two-component system OmpR family response regulator|uniref:DNA-binding response regulator n=1 Tax=Lactococcus garvieae DCC43 TaxID=1231377 RepID=K2PTK1_9LACT|nr:response regulator transcription factor [Lactococcus garvieae]EKF50826.1 DNA-binding response regulator [Lactococcus garvieae DCC43]QPS71544.1 response regulator transcription factor [Lactococcus garvieae]